MGKNLKRRIVISAINFFEGGPLTILKENLGYANDFLTKEYSVIVLVHKKELFQNLGFKKIIFFEFPTSRKSYINRLYFEYYYFKKLSKKWKPHLWFSLHDITPNVDAKIRAVYCHNPAPFKRTSIKDLLFQPIFYFFTIFYKYLYQINILKNNYVIVQQIWLKKSFVKLFKIAEEKVVVCYPNSVLQTALTPSIKSDKGNETLYSFFYPSFPRPFKNFEIIGESIQTLIKNGIENFNVVLTISGNENKYAKFIYAKYKHLKQIQFIGKINIEGVHSLYAKSDCLLFPSTLETWGLPITEFKAYKKPILLADLRYAHETLGKYDKGSFFNPLHSAELAEKMANAIEGKLIFSKTHEIDEEILSGWPQLYDTILKTGKNV